MSHGSTCGCGICTIGKKMGMIKKDESHQGHDHSQEDTGVCPTCHVPLGQDGTCAQCSVSK